MKRISILTPYFFALVLMSSMSCTEPNDRPKLKSDEVQEVLDSWLELWASYDLDMVPDIFWDSPTATYFSSEKEGLIKGYESFIPHHEGFGFVSGGKPAEKSLWLEQSNITIHDITAVIEAIWYFGDKTTPKEQVQNGPVSFVMIRDKNGDVKIAHTHFANYESWKTAGS